MPSEAARREVAKGRRRLAKSFPLPFPVRLQWVSKSLLWREHQSRCDGAYVYWHDETNDMQAISGLIRISHECNQDVAVDTLKHEWAHLLRHLVPGYDPVKEPHDAIYWAILGTVEKSWHGE